MMTKISNLKYYTRIRNLKFGTWLDFKSCCSWAYWWVKEKVNLSDRFLGKIIVQPRKHFHLKFHLLWSSNRFHDRRWSPQKTESYRDMTKGPYSYRKQFPSSLRQCSFKYYTIPRYKKNRSHHDYFRCLYNKTCITNAKHVIPLFSGATSPFVVIKRITTLWNTKW